MLILLLAVPPLGMVAAIIITLRLAKKKRRKPGKVTRLGNFEDE